MPTLSEALPNINYYLHENKTQDLLHQLNEGVLDILILPLLKGMEEFESHSLFEEPLLLATAKDHPFAKKKKIQLSDLKDQHVLTLEDGHCLRDQSLGYCFSANAEEDARFQATSLETLRYMVASGLGITLMPKLAAVNKEDDVSYIPIMNPEPTREIVLLVRPHYTRMECVQSILDSLQKSINNF